MCKGTLMVTNLRAIFVEVKVAIAKRVFTHHHHPLFFFFFFLNHCCSKTLVCEQRGSNISVGWACVNDVDVRGMKGDVTAQDSVKNSPVSNVLFHSSIHPVLRSAR
jgi:hypothetical protein